MKKYHHHITAFLIIIFICCILFACAPTQMKPTPPVKDAKNAQETPAPGAFPYGTNARAITAYIWDIPDSGMHKLPIDQALQDYFADYISRAQPAVFDKEDKIWSGGCIQVHFDDQTLSYLVWFDEETELFCSALFNEDNYEECWKLPAQVENPLVFEIKNRNGELRFEMLPQGKLLQAFTWTRRGAAMDVELRYTGNLEIWINDTKHVIRKDYLRYSYQGMPYAGLDEPSPFLRRVVGRNGEGRETMLFLSHQTVTNGIGTWESWELYRIHEDRLEELYIAPGHEEDLTMMVKVRKKEFFLTFPILEQELPLSVDDFSWWYETTVGDVLDFIKKNETSGELATMFQLWDMPVFIDYAEYWSDRGPSTDQITLWCGINGPAHYYQGYIKVTYDITVEGLVPKWVSW